MKEDTICALATATGGALSVIRVSGENSLLIVNHICSKDIWNYDSNTVHLVQLMDGKSPLDDAVVTLYKSPRSYTGEDSVELTCHGSPYISKRVLELLIQHGCRMAHPGEFTQRAFLNGKMDLSQAEAVSDLISATNQASHHVAISQLRGNFSSELSIMHDELLKLTSLVELELDFSDHEDLEFADRGELLALTQRISDRIDRLIESYRYGQVLKEGIPVAIVGKTNVGKSTLLNQLLKEDRAIVSDIHGTTRDTVEDTIEIKGLNFRFIDTAGLRQTTDEVEQIGIQRTYQSIDRSRIVIWLIDDTPTDNEIKKILTKTEDKHLLIVWNKSDIHPLTLHHIENIPIISLSAKTGYNIDQLEAVIYEAVKMPELQESDVIITNARHYDALLHAKTYLQNVRKGMKDGVSGDLLSEDLRQVIQCLAEITGEQITTADILTNIFEHFCVGK